MPETIQDAGSGPRWHWYNVMSDLRTQGGVDAVIDPMTVRKAGCGGTYDNSRFFISWVQDRFLLLTMTEYRPELVEAFAKVVGYRPFCRYVRDELHTVEWERLSPATRLAELRKTRGVIELQELT